MSTPRSASLACNVDAMSEPKALAQFMSATECAELVGIRLETFTAYVNRGYAPKPVGEIVGRRVYDRAEIVEWAKSRPGRRK